jgi:hypothetical protein
MATDREVDVVEMTDEDLDLAARADDASRLEGMAIRPFTEGDEDSVNDGFNRVFRLERSLEEWAWKFPPDDRGRTIMLAEADGELLAHYAGVPVELRLDGRDWPTAQIVDVFSTRAARAAAFGRRGVWVRTVEAFFDHFGRGGRLALLYGFPSPRPLRLGVLQLGYDAVTPQPIVHLHRRVSGRSRRLRSRLYRAEPAADWEPRLDRLWHRVRSYYPAAVVRDAAYALRRYAGHPHVRYHRFLVLPRIGSEPVGWVVLRVENGVCQLVDLLWDRSHPGVLELVSHLSSLLASQTGCVSEEGWLNGDADGLARLQDLGFVAGPEPRQLVFVARAFHPELDVTALDGRIYLTMGDSDLV